MQPDSMLAADAGNFGDGIGGVRGSRSHCRTHEAWDATACSVLCDLTGKLVRTHRKVLVDGNRPQILRAQAGDFGGLFHRGMCLRGAIGNEFAVTTFCVAYVLCGALAPGEQCAERRT